MSHDQGTESSATFRAYVQHFELSLRDVALAANHARRVAEASRNPECGYD